MGTKTKLIKKSTLLEILGISESRLYQLEKDGIAEKKGEGYKVIETLKNYVEMTKKRNGGNTSETLSLSELAIFGLKRLAEVIKQPIRGWNGQISCIFWEFRIGKVRTRAADEPSHSLERESES